MTKGRKLSHKKGANIPFALSDEQFAEIEQDLAALGIPRSAYIRQALAVFHTNPGGLWAAFCETATPEQVRRVMTGASKA